MPSLSEFERLFLLEFFVDYVTIQNTSFDHSESTFCVSFQFLHYPVMRVCEESFTPKPNLVLTEDSKMLFKKGKSCLFSIHSDVNNKVSSHFDLVIAVCQKSKECKERCLIGQAAVDLGDGFLGLLQATTDSMPEPKNSEKYDLFPLKDKFKRTVGTVAAFARLSHFGKIIITQFQLAAEDNLNYMFKGTDAKTLFKDDPMMKFPIIEREQKSPPLETETATAKTTSYTSLISTNARDNRPKPAVMKRRSSSSWSSWSSSYTSSSYSTSSYSTSSSSHTSSTISSSRKYYIDDGDPEYFKKGIKNIERLRYTKDDENYKEIEAEINGHSITIHVVKKSKKEKLKTPPLSCCQPLEPPICLNAPKLRLCDCDYPLPLELIPPRCPTQCCSIGSAENAASLINRFPQQSHTTSIGMKRTSEIQSPLNIPSMSPSQEQANLSMSLPVCPREDCPLGFYSPSPPPDPLDLDPGCVAMRGDQVFFQMTNRPAGEPVNEKEKKLAGSVYYRVGATEGGKETMRNFVQITPQSPTEPLCDDKGTDGPVSGIPFDNKQDMFLLKVLQQNYSESAKCKLEMELRTPKEKEPKPESNTVDTQCLVTDFPPVEKKKGKGGGKKGKKGKK